MASTGQRRPKREIQDENKPFQNNFDYLRFATELRKSEAKAVDTKSMERKKPSSRPRLGQQPVKAVHGLLGASRRHGLSHTNLSPAPQVKQPRNLRRLSLPLRPLNILPRPSSSSPTKSFSNRRPGTLEEVKEQEESSPSLRPRPLRPSLETVSPSRLHTPPATASCLPAAIIRPASLTKMRRTLSGSVQKPWRTLRGSLRAKVADQVRASVMRGKQDYALPNETGQLEYLRFLTAQQTHSGTRANRMDVQLQQKIDHEIKMRDGTAKLLAASKHPSQLLEAAKNLLTSNARMIAYMSELQRRKTDEVLNRHRKAESVKLPCKAKVALSDIRIPLMWRDSDHFKNKGDHRRFAVFCVLKIGTQIYDTMLLKDVDSSMTDLTFDDVIVFENMDPDFECQLEVYCHRVCDDHSVSSTPRRLKKKFNEISTSVGRSVGRRLSGLKDDPEFMANMIVGPRFEMIASATLTLADVRDSISIFDLPANCSASTEGGSTELPLFGNFCCRLAAQPRCMMVEVAAGYAQLKAGSEPWRKQWCMLGRQNLHMWSSERDQKEGQDPVLDITITSDARVKDLDEKTETGHVVQMTAWSNGRRRTFQLALESVADRDVWSSSLQQHITDIGAWKQACDKVMDIEQTTPPNRRSVFGQRPRSSLYEETPWNDDDSPMTRMLNRLDMEEQQRDSLKPV